VTTVTVCYTVYTQPLHIIFSARSTIRLLHGQRMFFFFFAVHKWTWATILYLSQVRGK